jgi:hypothetical protein
MPALLSLRPTKPLDAMNRLGDMGRFPVPVHAGATLNVLLTIALTLAVFAHWGAYPCALPLWIGLVLCANLIPVAALRTVGWRANVPYPSIEQMSFVGDQHRFPDWVYLAASADMAFWIALAWCADATLKPQAALLGVQALAVICTLAPVWLRILRKESA